MATLLANRGISSVVVHNYGGDHLNTLTAEEQMMHNLVQTVKEPFMIQIQNPSRSADYMVHNLNQ
jgi:hypothetical protein